MTAEECSHNRTETNHKNTACLDCGDEVTLEAITNSYSKVNKAKLRLMPKTRTLYTLEEWEIIYSKRAASVTEELRDLAISSYEIIDAKASETEDGEQTVAVVFSVRGAERLFRIWRHE